MQSSFGIAQSQMVGWWVELERGAFALPVRSSDSVVKVTTYIRRGNASLIVLANFGHEPVYVKLRFNWTALGLDSVRTSLRVPELRVPVQPAQNSLPLGATIKVPAPTHGAIDSVEGVILLLEATRAG